MSAPVPAPVLERRWLSARSRRVHGFTLVELVCVIIIVGVLAAIAVPRYIALGQDARIAALRTIEGSVASAAMIVNAAMIAHGGSPDSVTCAGGGVANNSLSGAVLSARKMA